MTVEDLIAQLGLNYYEQFAIFDQSCPIIREDLTAEAQSRRDFWGTMQ